MKITEQIKQELETYNKGCKETFLWGDCEEHNCGEKESYGYTYLCSTCKKKNKSSKEAFKNGCLIMIKDELKKKRILFRRLQIFSYNETKDVIKSLKEELAELTSLKEYLLGEMK